MRQPMGTIVQNAYVTDDLERGIQAWAGVGIAGPFFVLPHLEIVEPRYRGAPTDADISIAIAFSGGVGIELIRQHNDSPSVFNEQPVTSAPRYHHSAIMTEEFDAEVERYREMDYAIAYEGAVAVGGRFAYIDLVSPLGGMLEIIEVTPLVRQLFETIENASDGWDGSDLIRHF